MTTSRLIPIITVTLMFLSAISSCKTSEENYRKAYETALRKESAGIDSTIYSRIRQEARPETVTIGNDTMALKSEYVSVSDGQDIGPSVMKRYNIVAGQFKQVFHARSLKKRLAANGYPEAFIVETREPLYYVIAVSDDNPSRIAAALNAIKTDLPVRLTDPCPWVLRPANR